METVITSSVLIIAILFIRFVFKGKISRRLQYGLWALVAIRLLLPFSFSVPAPVSVMNAIDTSKAEQFITGQSVNFQSNQSSPVLNNNLNADIQPDAIAPFHLTDYIKIVWGGGIAVVGIWFAVVNITFYVRLKKRRKKFQVDNCKLSVYVTDSIPSPCLFGLLKPSIYLTQEVSEDPQKTKHVITHELCHYAQLDHIWSVVRTVCMAVHWFNPLVWVAGVYSRFDCELACDELAVKRLGNEERLAYGRTLVELVSLKASSSALVSAATTMTSSGKQMKERVSMIANSPKTLITALLAVIAALGIIAGCTFTGASRDINAEQAAEHLAKSIQVENSSVSFVNPTDYKNTQNWNMEQLKSILAKYTTNQILFFQSFTTGDNQNAAFVTVDGGEVWFATDSGAQKLKTGLSFREGDQSDTTFLWTVDNTIIFKCEDFPGGSSSISYAWYVKDGKPVELLYTGMNLSYIGNGQFTTIGEDFDFDFTDGIGAGHTYKLYYLYWTTDGLKEYGGGKITQQQLLKMAGAQAIIDTITKSGYTVDEIYYRANNIININYHSGDKQNGRFNNVTLVYENNTVTPELVVLDPNSSKTESFNENNLSDFSYGGIYQAAFFSKIATYPDKFPIK